ncbi:MAG: hypothetical protein WD716_10940 [Fimbriimonadaceae bacterium]
MRISKHRAVLTVALLSLATANAGPGQSHTPFADVRVEARVLADDWVRTASVASLDDLALRTAAFAGLVPKTIVTLDDRQHAADHVLMDSANTILGQHTAQEDAQAARNITYTLDLIASGEARGPGR